MHVVWELIGESSEYRLRSPLALSYAEDEDGVELKCSHLPAVGGFGLDLDEALLDFAENFEIQYEFLVRGSEDRL